jgi:hypothetical protein
LHRSWRAIATGHTEQRFRVRGATDGNGEKHHDSESLGHDVGGRAVNRLA